MRVLAVHADVVVAVSAVYQTTCTAVRAGEEGFVIDSPVLPDELEALPAVLEQAGFAVSALLATHGDWDHLLGLLAFPQASLGCAESTARRIRAEPGAAARELRNFDEEYYIERPRPLSLPAIQELPVPGHLALGETSELELHPTAGHTADGMAIWTPWTRTLVCGDYLSPVEIPMLHESGSLRAYRATLKRLRPLVELAETVVPGHGKPLDREPTMRLLEEDLAYLEALEQQGSAAPLPTGRATREQRRVHERNVSRIRR